MKKLIRYNLLLLACLAIFIGQASPAQDEPSKSKWSWWRKKDKDAKVETEKRTVWGEKRDVSQKKGRKKRKRKGMGWWAKRRFVRGTTDKKGIVPKTYYFKRADKLDPEKFPMTEEQKATWDAAVDKIDTILKTMEPLYDEYKTLRKELQNIYKDVRKKTKPGRKTRRSRGRGKREEGEEGKKAKES